MKYYNIRKRKLSAMTLGTVQLGLNYGINNTQGKPSHEKCFSMLRAALTQGVTSIDTAHAYGDSELVLGDFFQREWKGELPVLTTKFKLSCPPGSPDALIEQEITQSLESSLERLGVRAVDYVLLHNANDLAVYGSAVEQTLKRLMQKGYFTTPGLSVYYPNELDMLLDHPFFCAVQLPMGILDQRLVRGGYLQRLQENGIDVFVRSVFQQGLCFMDPDCMEDELRTCASEPVRRLQAFAQRANMSVAQFAVSFIRDLPGVTSLVLGADDPAQVNEDIALLDGPPIPQNLLEEAMAAFAQIDYEGIMTVLRRAKPQSQSTEKSNRIRHGG